MEPVTPPSEPAAKSSLRTWWHFLRHWGISLASFVGGLLTLFVFRREVTQVRWVIGYLLLLWLLFAVMAQRRQQLESRGRRLIVTAADYLIQTLYHGILLFLLPAYWASTTLGSVNVVFLAVLVGLALLATFDPWYRALVLPYPASASLFFVVSIFGALNVALPLVGLRPRDALVASAFLAVLALAPLIRRARDWSWARTLAVMTGLAFVGAGAASVGRAWIPPAPLSLGRATMARAVDEGRPVGALGHRISVTDLRTAGGLVAYTPIHAPAGLRQPVAHVWRLRGQVVDWVSLSPVRGGRREGFRTYSRKTGFPPDLVGPWSVDVVTESGQLIGRLRFRVTP